MASGSVSIHVRNLHKKFRAETALQDVTLRFGSGDMHGVIGPEGAGKTTLMRLILGLLTPTSGQVEFQQNDQQISFEDIRPSIAYMPQQQSLYPDLSIDEHLNFFKELYGIPKHIYAKRREELLEMTRLKEFTDRSASKLSGGMYKKLGLMCALLRSPTVMLLDEPTNGVDPISRREFWELLYKLLKQDILIVVTTAYMDEAERCGHVHLIEKGRVVDSGVPRSLLEQNHVQTFDELFLKRGVTHVS